MSWKWLTFWKKRHQHKKQVNHRTRILPNNAKNVGVSTDLQKLSKKFKLFSNEYWQQFRNLLIQTDMGPATTALVLSKVQRQLKNQQTSFAESITIIKKTLVEIYGQTEPATLNLELNRLNVIMMVGVNGTGKTTTIAKIAYRYLEFGQKIMLIAGDTFRAGAVEQLKVWSERLGVSLFQAERPQQDPASVVFAGLTKALAEHYDLVIIDTAGRLQNKKNLMAELTKINNIISKKVSQAPHETLLVMDSMVGMSGFYQAQVFMEAVSITGIVLTKIDTSAKGGIVFAIKKQLNLGVKLIGTGEGAEDLKIFDINQYVAQLLPMPSANDV